MKFTVKSEKNAMEYTVDGNFDSIFYRTEQEAQEALNEVHKLGAGYFKKNNKEELLFKGEKQKLCIGKEKNGYRLVWKTHLSE
jgi:hypothetical protein